jgi:hypothetical protein
MEISLGRFQPQDGIPQLLSPLMLKLLYLAVSTACASGSSSDGRTGLEHLEGKTVAMDASTQSWQDVSLFAFATPELEALFKEYLAISLTSSLSLVCASIIIVGWVVFALKLLTTGAELRDLSPQVYFIGLLHSSIAAATVGIMLLKPQFYAKFRKVINASAMLIFMATFRSSREMMLWIRFVDSKSAPASLIQLLQSLSVENAYTSTTWLMLLGFSSGQILDVVIATLFLLFELARNKSICASPYWDQRSVTLRPRFLKAAEMVSGLLREGVGGPLLWGPTSGHAFSCPAALGVWQVMGWALACVTVFVADILRRRAFLRTREARNFVGPAYAAVAHRWPFSGTAKVQWCLRGLYILWFSACVIWTTALPWVG